MKQKGSSKKSRDIWRGRLGTGLDETALTFISGMEEDRRLVEYDIRVNQAHVLMLKKKGIVDKKSADRIVKSLERARAEHKRGLLLPKYPRFVDVHPIIEQFVIDDLGVDVGGKIHIAKSRNDQVMADIRLYMRDEFLKLNEQLLSLISTMLSLAGKHRETVMPGYTHTQHAQVTSFAHYLLSHVDVLLNDVARIKGCYSRMNLSPLGACAFAGTSVPIDRHYTAKLLGFDGIVENATTAVSSRDVLQEAACVIALLMSGLSRIASDIILWSTFEFGMVELSDEMSDTSSAMPQKKNPDPMEAIRGKANEAISSCANVLSLVRGLVIGYHKDFQEMKRPLWKSMDDARFSVAVMTKALKTLIVKKQRMLELVLKNNVTAMDLAEYLAMNTSLSFREAHFLVGLLVRETMNRGKGLSAITSDQLTSLAKKKLGKKVAVPQGTINRILDPIQSLRSRVSAGGPSPSEVARMIRARTRTIK